MIDLTKYLKEIRSYEPLKTNLVVYRPEKWKKGFDDRKHLKGIAAFENKKISRETIIRFYRQYYRGKVADAMSPFLLTMVWGYDSPGFGPFRVNRFMVAGNEALIHDALEAVRVQDIKKAFKLLMKVEGLGISFVSKVLYFAARAMGFEEYPLIFDIQVAISLVSLASGGVLDKMVNVSPSTKYAGYDAYNKLLHGWAKELKVEAEEVEYFIFRYNAGKNVKKRNLYG